MSEQPDSAPDERAGILFAGAAYTFWGFLPLYWNLLNAVPALQITASRVVFGALTAGAITLARGRGSRLLSIATTAALIRNLVVSAALIGVNWTIFVYAVSAHHIVETSLGYYILPLISAVLGVALFDERLSRQRIAALALGAIAVTVQAAMVGHFPWIALSLAVSFGFYGYFRKLTPVPALDGLLIEMLVLLPLALAIGVYWWGTGALAFGHGPLWRDLVLLGAGPVTVLPLSLFAAGARRIRLSTLGFLQYLAPTISLLIATLMLGEPFTPVTAITFGCVWVALGIVAAEGRIGRFSASRVMGE